MEPLQLINALRKTDLYIEMIFMQGGCYRFHLFLKELFPAAMPYINKDRNHVITRIGGHFYDIKGIVKKKDLSEYYQLEVNFDIQKVKKWSFGKNMLLQLKECPFCEEPLTV